MTMISPRLESGVLLTDQIRRIFGVMSRTLGGRAGGISKEGSI